MLLADAPHLLLRATSNLPLPDLRRFITKFLEVDGFVRELEGGGAIVLHY